MVLNYMTQYAFMVTNQTGKKGAYVKRVDAVTDVSDILSGQVDDWPAEKFLYKSTLADIKQNG